MNIKIYDSCGKNILTESIVLANCNLEKYFLEVVK